MAYFPHYWELALGWSPDQYIRFSSILGTLSCFPSYDMKSIATLLVLFPTSEHVVSFEAYLAGLKLDYTSGEITWEWEEEKERWEKEKIWETVTAVENEEELKKEIKTIENLIEKAEEILKKEVEVKIKELKKAMEEGFKKIREIGAKTVNDMVEYFKSFKKYISATHCLRQRFIMK